MFRPDYPRHRRPLRTAWVVLAAALLTPAFGSPPGLPFSEDFTTTNLRDSAKTSADWNTSLGVLRLPSGVPLNNVVDAALPGSDIGSVGASARKLALADFDGDGDLDLLIAGNGSTRIFFNNGTSTPFTSASVAVTLVGSSGTTRSVAVEDFDLDGDLDIVLAEDTGGSDNLVYFNNGGATPFAGVAPVNLGNVFTSAGSVDTGDFDNDGDPDIVVGNLNGADRYYVNNGSGSFAEFSITPPPTVETRAVRLGDMNGDGLLDLVVATTLKPIIVNGESRLDLATGTTEGTYLYLNNGTGTPFTNVAPTRISDDENKLNGYDPIALGDVNGDGCLDVLVGNLGFDRLYLNNCTGPGADPFSGVSGSNISTDQRNTYSTVLVDIDRDGDLDYIAGNRARAHGSAADNVANDRLYLNNGNGVFSAGIDISADATIDTNSLVADDIDGNGTIDIVAGWDLGVSRYYLNRGTPSGAPATAQLRGDGRSLRVDTETSSIVGVHMASADTRPSHTSIRYWLTNDGGSTWKLAHPGHDTSFVAAGGATDLRWRAELRTLSRAKAPSVDSLSIQLTASGGGTGPYQQQSDGSVTIEAEHADANVNVGGLWGLIAPSGASGGQAMEASVDGSPRLEYRVDFSQTGTHYVWVRSWGSSSSSDSAFFGVDGGWTVNTVNMSPRNSWVWQGPFAITIGSVGVHTLGVNRREPLAQVDKLFVSRSASAVPTGTGPSESVRGSGTSNAPPTVTITAPATGTSFVQATTVNFTANASDTEDGNLTASITWSSSRDGNLGTLGGAFSTSALSVGTHVITATVTDSGLVTGSSSITITITSAGSGGGTGAYTQGSDGSVSIEAEHADANVNVGGGVWALIAPSGASGGQAMEASVDGSPRLEYRVDFSQTGTHYVWVRSWGSSSSSDSAFFGVDGGWTVNTVNMSPRNSWVWQGPFAITIGSVGVHTLGVNRREPLAQVDKLFVSRSASAVPTGTGPSESVRGSN
ncbi:MAG: FG-GAP-like repeat-containing protein [Gammaproteobacteria bacterium]